MKSWVPLVVVVAAAALAAYCLRLRAVAAMNGTANTIPTAPAASDGATSMGQLAALLAFLRPADGQQQNAQPAPLPQSPPSAPANPAPVALVNPYVLNQSLFKKDSFIFGSPPPAGTFASFGLTKALPTVGTGTQVAAVGINNPAGPAPSPTVQLALAPTLSLIKREQGGSVYLR